MKFERVRRAGFRTVLLVVMALPLPAAVWAAATASLDRASVHEGDSVNLTIISDGKGGGGQPDLTPLEQAFQVLATRHGTQVQIINGSRSDRVTWVVELQPRRTGTIEIPALTVGTDTTRPLTLQVSESPAGATADVGDAVFITVSAEPADGTSYVQEQIRYKVKLFSREQILDGTLAAPRPENAVVEQLGQDRTYTRRVAGHVYQVIERDYAIFPEKSGELRIPPVAFRGSVASPGVADRSANPFGRTDSMMSGMFQDPFFRQFFNGRSLAPGFPAARGESVRIQGAPVVLDVQPRAAGFDGPHWLPAQAVTLTDSWVEGAPRFVAGEPLTRTVTLEAKGAVSSQLPEVRFASGEGFRVYPEQQEQKNATDGEWVYGRLSQSFSVMPTQAGKIVFPEVRVSWWDAASDQARVAAVPGFEVEVLPGAGASQDAAVAELSTPVAATRDDIPASAPGPDAIAAWHAGLVPWLLGALLAALITAVIGSWRRAGVEAPRPAWKRYSGNRSRTALHRACRGNDAAAASQALIAWAAELWPEDPPRNLLNLSVRLERGAKEIQDLNRVLYGARVEVWVGAALWQAVGGGLRQPAGRAVAAVDPLPPLYPQHP